MFDKIYNQAEINSIKNKYANLLDCHDYDHLILYFKSIKDKVLYKILKEIIYILETNVKNIETLDMLIDEHDEYIYELEKKNKEELWCYEKLDENF